MWGILCDLKSFQGKIFPVWNFNFLKSNFFFIVVSDFFCCRKEKFRIILKFPNSVEGKFFSLFFWKLILFSPTLFPHLLCCCSLWFPFYFDRKSEEEKSSTNRIIHFLSFQFQNKTSKSSSVLLLFYWIVIY